jgi:hypothetical protein
LVIENLLQERDKVMDPTLEAEGKKSLYSVGWYNGSNQRQLLSSLGFLCSSLVV